MNRAKRYEEAILARLEAKAEHTYQWPRWPAAYEAAQAAVEVADEELEDLRAEVKRLRKDVAGQTRSAQNGWRNADKFRAELADLRAKVEEAHPRVTLPAHHQRQPPPVPDRCRTCRQADGNLAEWPCPTMRAVLEGGR
jgi:hypothetical protein